MDAADLNVGYIDSARIFAEYGEAKEAQERFDRQVQGWRDEATEKEKVVAQLRAEVRDQSPILSALKRQEKDEALQRAAYLALMLSRLDRGNRDCRRHGDDRDDDDDLDERETARRGSCGRAAPGVTHCS